MVLGLEDLGAVNLQQLRGANEVSEGRGGSVIYSALYSHLPLRVKQKLEKLFALTSYPAFNENKFSRKTKFILSITGQNVCNFLSVVEHHSLL